MAGKGYIRYGGNDGGRFEAWREWTWSWNDLGDATFVDVDAVYACPKCKQALCLIELAAKGPKPVSVLRALARRADVPALLVQCDVTDGEMANTSALWVNPMHRAALQGEAQLEAALRRLRDAHSCPVL